MDKMKGLAKGGWHPPGDPKISRDTWKSDLKGMATGKKKDPYEEARNHQSTPLTTLKDPDAFGPPPKHSAYHGSGQTVAGTKSDQSGLGATVASPSRLTHQQRQEQAQQEQEAAKPPPGPYCTDTTGLRTDNLPKPPARRTDSQARQSASPASARPAPSLPPRLPARQTTGGPPPPPPPRQSEYPDEYTPAPPPPYAEAAAPTRNDGSISQGAASRLAQAGVSVPGLGIGANSTPPESSSSQGRPQQLSELQQRFARMTANEVRQPAAQAQDTRPSWQQQQQWQQQSIPRPGSSGFAENAAAAPPPATQTSTAGKKPPPPPPPKHSTLSSGNAPASPPLPLATSRIRDLLFGHRSEREEEKSASQSEPLETQPEIVPVIRKFEFETPTDRWRQRKTLGVPAGYVDKPRITPINEAHELKSEIVFKWSHKSLLDPPRQPLFVDERRLDFTTHRKMRSYVQVLTTPTADTPGTTLILHFDNKRYLIGNLAEGMQRASVQMGARLLKVNECFITGRTEWSNTGGLIGIILTLADAAAASKAASTEDGLKKAHAKAKRLGVQDDPKKVEELEEEVKREFENSTLTLFGAPNLNHTLATARRFVFRKGMPVDVHEVQEERKKREGEDEWAPYWADTNIKVWAMSIKPAAPAKPSTANGGIHQPRPVSPRKRSIDEMYELEQSASNGVIAADDLTTAERDQLTVKAVVGEMFSSSWRLDTLYETPLSQVRLPATIFIRNAETNKVERYRGPMPGGPQPLPDPHLKVLVRKPWPGALIESLPHTEPAKEAISYIIRNHIQRGKFHPEKAVALKVEQGFKWAQLSAGNTVENADGETVRPEQVLGESKEGGGLAVVDLPSPEYIENLVSRPEWREAKVMAGVGAVVWICGGGVAKDSRLRAFMDEHSHLKHVVSSPEYCPNNIALDSVAAATVRLAQIDPSRYGIPVHDNAPPTPRDTETSLPDCAQVAVRGQKVQLEPSLEVQNKQNVKPLDVAATKAKTSQEVLEEARTCQSSVAADREQQEAWASNMPSKDAELVTLGTGSALPSKYRNVSATLLRVPGWGSMLFDCGENTLGQLKRVYPPQELKRLLRELRLIFISHMHADHHLGTVGVVKAWYQEVHCSQPAPTGPVQTDMEGRFQGQQRLAIVSEPAMQHWLSEYAAVEDYGFSRIAPIHISPAMPRKGVASKLGWFIPLRELARRTSNERQDLMAANVVAPSLLNLNDVQAVAVQHCHGSRAVSITFPSGFKASYSGDCRPSTAFTQIGKGSTVCIHEATFDDGLQGDAEAKNHSTTSEALGVAQAMGAKACVLTHFSQRYQKLPVLEPGNGSEADGAAVPKDLPSEDEPSEESAKADDDLEGPLEDVAATFPDQPPSNGKSFNTAKSGIASNGPAAVKFKLHSDMKVCVAFDYMRIKVGEIAQMEKFIPALIKLLAEEEKPASETASLSGKRQKNGKKQGKKERSKGEVKDQRSTGSRILTADG